MAGLFDIKIEGLDGLTDELGRFPKDINLALLKSINRTLTTARKEAVKRVRKDAGYVIPAKLVKERLAIDKARFARLVGAVVPDKRRFPLVQFRTRQTKKKRGGGVVYTIRRSEGRQLIPSGFIAPSPDNRLFAWKRVGMSAYPIDPKFGPSVARMFEVILAELSDDMSELVAKRFDDDLEFRRGRR